MKKLVFFVMVGLFFTAFQVATVGALDIPGGPECDPGLACDPASGTCCGQCDPGPACVADDPNAIPCCSADPDMHPLGEHPPGEHSEIDISHCAQFEDDCRAACEKAAASGPPLGGMMPPMPPGCMPPSGMPGMPKGD